MVPLFNIYNAVTINTSYARSEYWFENAVKDGVDLGSTSVALDERIWLYNPGNTTPGEIDSLDADRVSHQQRFWSASVVAAVLMAVSIPKLDQKYLVAEQLKTLEETPAETPEDSPEDDASEEDMFF